MPGAENASRPGDRDRLDHSSGPDGPRSVGGYRLLRRIGEGGMSTVYLSYDVPARRPVALKLLSDHLAGQPEFVNRFYREARLSRLLHHPNIVHGYTTGYDPEVHKHFLVLEFVDGPSAHSALVKLGRLPVGVAVKIGIDIARALHFLHDRNYVHRDVKPDNVLLHTDGTAKLADLGLTKRLADDTHLTSVNQGVGTSYYMPYEQALNAALVDGRSDIFALGATLYHLLTGQVPFPGATHEDIIREKEHDAFTPVRVLNPDVPEVLAGIVATTLARDPRARYQDAAALAAALEATGLATRIPSFAPTDATDIPTPVDHPAPDIPTRADLPVGSAGPTPDSTPVPPTSGGQEAGDEDPPPPTRTTPLVATGVLVCLGLLGGCWSRPSACLRPDDRCETAVHDRVHAPATGPLPGTPQ